MSDKKEQEAAQKPKQQISIQSDPQSAAGVYSNLMMVTHRKEEFVLDFLFAQPQKSQQGQTVANLRSRVITTPEHIKRIVTALNDNVRRYEEQFGEIEAATDLPKVMH